MKKVTFDSPPVKAIKKKDTQKRSSFPHNLPHIIVGYPVIWLALIAFVVYIRTITFGFTELDDTIFIRDFQSFNEDWSNLGVAFHRGLFDVLKDPYYRPLFLDSMIINYHFPGDGLIKYHLFNILLHMGATGLIYCVFRRLNMRKLDAFILATIFAVHPVLSQATAWIPGRNDTLLGVFAFSFFISAIDYSNFGKTKDIALSCLFLLLAMFTKETAIFLPVVVFIMIGFITSNKLASKSNISLLISTVVCFGIWYGVRAQSPNIQHGSSPAVGIMVTDFIHRLPLIVQYVGKIFLPVNQSVFPMQEDTSYIPGILAIVLLVAMLYFSKSVKRNIVIAGILIFIIALIPALLVPNKLNEQTFEHRLYLPMLGMLLVFSETFLFKNFIDSNTFLYSMLLAVILVIVNLVYQGNFHDPYKFWTQAVETSPHSAYAKMMLAAREDNMDRSRELFRAAYKLDPTQKYLNYYYGHMLQLQDSVLASEPYLLKEKQISDFVECDFDLARVAITKGDTASAISYMERYLERNPASAPAHNNLLLMYLSSKKYSKAKKHMEDAQKSGIKIDPQLEKMVLNPVPVVNMPAATTSAATSAAAKQRMQ